MNRRNLLASGVLTATAGLAGCLHESAGSDEYPPEAELDGEFVTVWKVPEYGVGSDMEIQLPLLGTGDDEESELEGYYDFTVDWGDGTSDAIDSVADADYKHVYSEPGEYVVTIDGTFLGLFPRHEGIKLREIRNWGGYFLDSEHTTFAFKNALSVTAEDGPRIHSPSWRTGGARLRGVFSWAYLPTATGIEDWDVSDVVTMERLFEGSQSFDRDLHAWDVSNVENMREMFRSADSFDGRIADWDVSNVEDMAWMFWSANSFDGDPSSWDVSRVEDMTGMFASAESFDSDLGDWDVSNVELMADMFSRAESFTGPIDRWDVSNVRDMGKMFRGASSFDSDLGAWDVSSVTNMEGMFRGAQSFSSDLSGWDVSNVTEMSAMFESATSFDSDLNAWDVSNVENMQHVFANASSFTGGVSQWNVSNVEDMTGLFEGAGSFDDDLSGWDVSSVKTMHKMFDGSGLSTENYDRILTSWKDLDLEDGVVFSARNTSYSPGEPADARQYIIDEYGWVISDGGKAG